MERNAGSWLGFDLSVAVLHKCSPLQPYQVHVRGPSGSNLEAGSSILRASCDMSFASYPILQTSNSGRCIVQSSIDALNLELGKNMSPTDCSILQGL